jgi:hypothetical protein
MASSVIDPRKRHSPQLLQLHPNQAPMYPNPPILSLPNPILYVGTPCASAKLME